MSDLSKGLLKEELEEFDVEVPSWGFERGGTRFEIYRTEEDPRSLEERIRAAERANRITGKGNKVSLHFPSVADLEEEVLSEENVDRVIDALKFNEKVSYVRGLGGIGLGDGGLYEPLHFLESAESSVKMTVMAERIGVDVKERQKEFESW